MAIKSPEAKARKQVYQRAYHHAHKERRGRYLQQWTKEHMKHRHDYMRERRLKRYGLTPEQFAELLAKQGNKCAICRGDLRLPTTAGKVERDLAVIDHKGQIVRGILCSLCNVGLGMFRDNPDFLAEAIVYLKRD